MKLFSLTLYFVCCIGASHAGRKEYLYDTTKTSKDIFTGHIEAGYRAFGKDFPTNDADSVDGYGHFFDETVYFSINDYNTGHQTEHLPNNGRHSGRPNSLSPDRVEKIRRAVRKSNSKYVRGRFIISSFKAPKTRRNTKKKVKSRRWEPRKVKNKRLIASKTNKRKDCVVPAVGHNLFKVDSMHKTVLAKSRLKLPHIDVTSKEGRLMQTKKDRIKSKNVHMDQKVIEEHIADSIVKSDLETVQGTLPNSVDLKKAQALLLADLQEQPPDRQSHTSKEKVHSDANAQMKANLSPFSEQGASVRVPDAIHKPLQTGKMSTDAETADALPRVDDDCWHKILIGCLLSVCGAMGISLAVIICRRRRNKEREAGVDNKLAMISKEPAVFVSLSSGTLPKEKFSSGRKTDKSLYEEEYRSNEPKDGSSADNFHDDVKADPVTDDNHVPPTYENVMEPPAYIDVICAENSDHFEQHV